MSSLQAHAIRISSLSILVVMLAATMAHGKVLLPPVPNMGNVTAADQAEAESAYNNAYGAYENGDMDGALDYAKAAFNALPNASTAILKAVILGAMEKSNSAFSAYLQARDLKPNAEEKEYVAAGLAEQGAKCDPAMGWAVIRTDPEGTTVRVGSETFKAPRTVGLSEGTFVFSFETDGYRPVEKEIEVTAGEAVPAKKSNINMTPEARKTVEPADGVDKADDGGSKETAKESTPKDTADAAQVTATATPSRGGPDGLTLGLLGGGGAMFVGSVVSGLMGSMAKSEAEEFEVKYNTQGKNPADKQSALDADARFQTMGTASLALLAVSVPVLGFGVYRLVSAGDAGSDAGAEAAAALTPVVLPEGGGAVLFHGSF